MLDYEARIKANEKQNEEYLRIFENELKEKGLSAKTIREHVSNVDLLLNHYLPGYEEDYQMADGMNSLYGFFDFFIRKCMWSTPASVKKMGASLKKFYKCMMEHGLVDKEEFKEFSETLKEEIPYTMMKCDDYNAVYMDY